MERSEDLLFLKTLTQAVNVGFNLYFGLCSSFFTHKEVIYFPHGFCLGHCHSFQS